MLKTIHIRNFALAKKLDIAFQQGLNIITGETGAGKSIIVGAISAVLGSRVFTEVVRTGEDKAFVEALFDISYLPEIRQYLEEKGLETQDELFLKREISIKGNTRAFVNDMPVPIATLADIGDRLVDIHGQNEHQSLLRQETHAYFLDAFGKLDEQVSAVSNLFQELKSKEAEFFELEKKQKELNEKYDLYEFQLSELEKANLKPGEDTELEEERKILANMERIFDLSSRFNQLLNDSGSGGVTDLLGQAVHLLGELSGFSGELKTIHQELASARIVVSEATRTVEEFQNKLEFNPERLEEIEQRLAGLKLLKKKYGETIEDILAYKNELESRLKLRDNFEYELKKLNDSFEKTRQLYQDTVTALAQIRREVAKGLETAVEKELHQVGMVRTRFKVNLDWQENPDGYIHLQGKHYLSDESGMDRVEFYISPNPGEDFKPLNKIASGGEISRIMLSLKNILAEIDKIPLLIFDEIDVGVSGRIALAVGKSIQNLSKTHQIISITHLPQIAAFGNAHYRVEKYVDDGRTFTQVVHLEEKNRVEEIARLMGGNKLSSSMIESARQLLEESR